MASNARENSRAALLIRCTREEAEVIRRAAAAERRTISGYILNAVYNRIHVRQARLPALPTTAPAPMGWTRPRRRAGD